MIEQLTLAEDPDAAVPVSPLDRFSWDALPESLPIAEEPHERFRALIGNWNLRLCLFRCAGGSRFYPTEAQIAVFTAYLVENQRNDPGLRFGRGSWAVPENTAMPSDAAVDYAFVPTHRRRLAGAGRTAVSATRARGEGLSDGAQRGRAIRLAGEAPRSWV